jgi:hypothetical protein
MSHSWHPEKFNRNLEKVKERRMLDSVLVVERNAKRRCPKKTGHLASTITHLLTTDSGNVSGFVIAGGSTSFGTVVFYAIYVEFGTKYFAGFFYMRGGLRESYPVIRKIWGIAA